MLGLADAEADGRVSRVGFHIGKQLPEFFKRIRLEFGEQRVHGARWLGRNVGGSLDLFWKFKRLQRPRLYLRGALVARAMDFPARSCGPCDRLVGDSRRHHGPLALWGVGLGKSRML